MSPTTPGRKQRWTLTLLIGCALFVLALASALLAATAQAQAPDTDVGGTIGVDTTWDLAGSPYILTGDVTVAAGVTLTIEPGVVVQSNGKRLLVLGTLAAIGSAPQPILFTSLTDTGPNQWPGIIFDGGGGALDHVAVRYAGSNTSPYGFTGIRVENSTAGVSISHAEIYEIGSGPTTTMQAVKIVDSQVTIDQVVFHDNLGHVSGAVVDVSGSSVVSVSDAHFLANHGRGINAGGTVTVANTVFEDNAGRGARMTPDNWTRAADLSFIGDEGAITTGVIGADTTFPTAWNAAYLEVEGVLTVLAGATVTVEPGNEIRSSSSTQIVIEGTLDALGTQAQPILFTSQLDSGPGQWAGLVYDGGGGALDHVTLRYAGGLRSFDYGRSALWVQNSPGVTLSNAQVYANDDNGAGGPVTAVRIVDSPFAVTGTAFNDNLAQVLDDSALRVDGNSAVSVDDVQFQDNVGGGIYAGGAVTITNTIFESNAGPGLRTSAANWSRAADLVFSNDEGTITGGAFLGDMTFPFAWGADYYNLDDPVTAPAGTTLVVEPGTEFRGDPTGALIALGNLVAVGTPTHPITFTSQQNSGPNQWDGIVIDGGYGELAHVTVRYAGNGGTYGYSALRVQDAASEVTIAHANIVDNNNVGSNRIAALHISHSDVLVENTTFSGNGGNAFDDSLQSTGDGAVVVRDSAFVDNPGTGIFASSVITVSNTTFQNQANGYGMRLHTGRANITCSGFLGNLEGIRVDGAFDDIFVGGSTFSGNADFGINNQDNHVVDALYNYWGDPSGPGGNGPGSGDPVSAWVLYEPWLESDDCVVQITGLHAGNDGPTIESLPTRLFATVATGSDVAYSWDFGDGAIGSGAVVDHTYAVAGSYTATVVAANAINTLTTTTLIDVAPRPSFGGTAWHDADGDGAQGPGESSLGGAAVTAEGPAGTLGDTTTPEGAYRIEIVGAGWYELSAALDGYAPTTPNPVTLPLPDDGSGQVDFGFLSAVPPTEGRLVGRVFADLNGNGLADLDDAPIVGLDVDLHLDGALQETVVSDSDGLFAFAGLAAGIYELRAQAPPGLYPDLLSAGDQVVVLGETRSVSLGFRHGGAVGGSVVAADGDGVANALLQLEQPGGTVLDTALSKNNGDYSFGQKSPGSYVLRLVPPPGFTPADGETARDITVASNGSVVENWHLDTPGSLTIRAQSWFNPNYVPIGGVGVTVAGPNGFLGTYSTSYDGRIYLEGLAPGAYVVTPLTATLPLDAVITPGSRQVHVAANSGASATFTVTLARAITVYCQRYASTSVPFGPGFPCRVEVRVVSDELGTPSGSLVGEAELAGGGVTAFGDLPTGTYAVAILPDDGVAGQETWPDHSETVVLNPSTYAVVNYPFNPSYASTTIWGYAFWDKNLDGQRQHWTGSNQSNDEANLSASNGLHVELLDEAGSLVATTETQQHATLLAGWFEFPDLAAGTYQVRILLPTGFNPASPTTLFRTVNLLNHADAAEFGYSRSSGADLRGRVFYDNDADGAFTEAIDDPQGGITTTLRAAAGAPLATAATSGLGGYAFLDQLSGEYLVDIAANYPDENPTSLVKPAGLPHGSSNVWVDFALLPTDGQGRVLLFVDEDLDGQPGPGEQRVGGVRILRYASDCRQLIGVVPQFAITDGGGLATFATTLPSAGCARVDLGDANLPSGVQPAQPLGAPAPAGSSAAVWLGLVPPGTLTVQPFWDANGNLALDPDEPVLAGVIVSVVGAGSVTSSHLGATFSLAEGAYAVTVSPPAGMSLAVSQPLPASLNANSAAALPVPLRYTGVIAGQVVSTGGAASFGGLTVELYASGQSMTAQVESETNSFLFANVPPATYQLRLVDVPPGYRLDGVPIIPYSSGTSVVEDVTLVPLGDVLGAVYLDANGNGQRGNGEPGTNSYDLFLLDNLGSPPAPVTVAADGTFLIPDLQSGRLYALTTDLDYPGYGPPGAAITEGPGWFSVENQNVEVRVGVFPWSGNDDFNVVLGQVYLQNGNARLPVAGAEVGYFLWDDDTGCSALGPPILGTTSSDVHGDYRLDTAFEMEATYYCLRVLDMPGYASGDELVVPGNMMYQSPGGLVVQPRIDAGKDLPLEPFGSNAAILGGAAVRFAAFHDVNANGLWDPSEQPLEGAGLGGQYTGSDGFGAVAGLPHGRHELLIAAPAGFASFGPAERVVFLSGASVELLPLPFRLDQIFAASAFVDYDGDGRQAINGHERGVAGVSVTLSGPVVTTTTTTPDGMIRLLGLPDGAYDVTVQAPGGYRPVADTTVALNNGAAWSIPLAPLGQLSGVVYEDWDGDGRRLPDEPLVAIPVTMTLGGVGDTRLFGGQLLFMNVPEGAFTLTPGWPAAEPIQVLLGPQTAGAVGLPAVDPGFLRGVVWHDANCDGRRGADEAPLAGIEVSSSGRTATTDAGGRFQFAGMAAGSHALDVQLPAGLRAGAHAATSSAIRGAAGGIPAEEGCGDHAQFLPLVFTR